MPLLSFHGIEDLRWQIANTRREDTALQFEQAKHQLGIYVDNSIILQTSLWGRFSFTKESCPQTPAKERYDAGEGRLSLLLPPRPLPPHLLSSLLSPWLVAHLTVHSSDSPSATSSCSIRWTVHWCRSTSRVHPRDCASAIKPTSTSRRSLSRDAYAGVVTNLAQVRYRSHSHGPSCGRRRQRPSSSSVFKKLLFSQSTACAESSPARKISAAGPAIVAPGPSTA